MKKYSADYFDKKFRILFDKLMIKDGFVDAVKEVRKELKIPEETGFLSKLEFAKYLLDRLSKKECEVTTTIAVAEQYEIVHKKRLDEIDMNDLKKEFVKKIKGESDPIFVMLCFEMHLTGHNDFFTKDPVITYGKKNSELFSKAWGLFKKFFALDLLDQHIIMQFIEKYLFLGTQGVNDYIKNKVACPHCRYIGVSHFSPERGNMEGQDRGPFSGKYHFNKNAVKMLSTYFDSVFIIIRPYATKEQVLHYIEDIWDDLKEHMIEKNTFYRQFGVNFSKIKEKDFDRNQLIYDLYKLSKKDILKSYDGETNFSGSGIYKEAVISGILKEKYGIEITPDAIKKSATRFAKSKEVKKKPKDIRDI